MILICIIILKTTKQKNSCKVYGITRVLRREFRHHGPGHIPQPLLDILHILCSRNHRLHFMHAQRQIRPQEDVHRLFGPNHTELPDRSRFFGTTQRFQPNTGQIIVTAQNSVRWYHQSSGVRCFWFVLRVQFTVLFDGHTHHRHLVFRQCGRHRQFFVAADSLFGRTFLGTFHVYLLRSHGHCGDRCFMSTLRSE